MAFQVLINYKYHNKTTKFRDPPSPQMFIIEINVNKIIMYRVNKSFPELYIPLRNLTKHKSTLIYLFR